jgi:lipopolysaccharide/colanic/teichoic acid biosynthesis glycosyltransferase/CheY-like chemotaxis protein
MEKNVERKGRILVVDADPCQRTFITKIATQEGYTVKAVPDGKSALEAISHWTPSIILQDVNLPEMDGYETVRQIRELEHNPYIPVLLVTAATSMDSKLKGFGAGADDFIVKPYNIQELLLRIQVHLRRCRHSSEPERYIPERNIQVPIVIRSFQSGLFRKSFIFSKRLFDILICLWVMPVALPLVLILALAVRFDSPGPVFFTQERTGRNGERFNMFKFRTMVENAEELKQNYAHLSELSWPDFKIANDPRTTRTGRFLRRSSLDELPQLFNILIGTMSLVGPRPTSFKADTYQLWQTERLEIRPGLTGLWQVSGRSDLDFTERVELDIEYIERQSWMLDLKILWQTFAAVIQARGAH